MLKTVLVTGGLGYLGSRLCYSLERDLGLDVRIGTHRKGVSRPKWSAGCDIVHIDYMSESSLDNACTCTDCIFHVAGLDQSECEKDFKRAMDVNVVSTHNLISAAARQNVNRVFLFSSAHVYGAPLSGYIDEETPSRPVHPYSVVHKLAEDIVVRSGNGIVFRLTNGIGFPLAVEMNRWNLVANDLCKQSVVNKRLKLLSTGLQQRDFIPISDVCRVCEHFIAADSDHSNEIFNVGGENTLRIIDLAGIISERCEKVLGYRPEIAATPLTDDAPTHPDLVFSIDKLKRTGFELQCSIESEIDRTLEFCREHFS